ncbi:methionyl-tRNA formyltransferase [Shimazuella kribbensis]|uniref:methionyl-tRNA formyltransferase n=1 Tax=Shimazuella kribbensis TaxID=139808 RepID=UPI00041AA603|nr:methionyl-tRNA formyltransferase [Shimazuella kribbensis]
MRVIFMGTPTFAVPSLLTLIEEGYEIVSVVTQPDRPVGRKKILTPPPVKEVAIQHHIPVFQPEKIRLPEGIDYVKEMKPDLIVTAAFGQILPREILEIPKFGCINVHASLLPKYRGGAPIHQALIDGEKETGVTIMYMVEALDAGDMINSRSIPITEEDHVGSLFEKLSLVGAELVKETLPALIQGKITPVPQNEDQATFAPNIKREKEEINWHRSAIEIRNQIRGMHPWPGAFTYWKGQAFKVWWAELVEETPEGKIPGQIWDLTPGGIFVATASGSLRLADIQPAGKKRLAAGDFVRGRQMNVGEMLGKNASDL